MTLISEIGYESLQEDEYRWGHTFRSAKSLLNYERDCIYYEDIPEEMKEYHPKSQQVKMKRQQLKFPFEFFSLPGPLFV